MLTVDATSMSLDEFKLRQALSNNEIVKGLVAEAKKSLNNKTTYCAVKRASQDLKNKMLQSSFTAIITCSNEENDFIGITIKGNLFDLNYPIITNIKIDYAG